MKNSMGDEVVVDASVAVDWLLPGAGSAAAAALVRGGERRVAPELIFVEFNSAAARFVRRRQVSDAVAREAIRRLPDLIDEASGLGDLASPAYDLAARHGFSTYDAVYLALALRRGVPLVTADAKLARRAVEVGLAGHVRLLTSEP